ncbi:hypothetical protein GIB67_028810 [Kingdonia uniflora]|uniref:Uncharacterized protein n=1 Tax=Kingdonia uniflora TaxID=39325 RepID=A0A7J7LT28_9MAGN|nr:hypothetical protein GIB67_028810 [Kingdonia uniflora]
MKNTPKYKRCLNISYEITTLLRRSRSRYSRRLQLIQAILGESPILDSDSMIELIKPHYEGARGRGTRGDYNLFKLILGMNPTLASDTNVQPQL